MKRILVLITALAVLAISTSLASASRLPLTPKNIKVFSTTSTPDVLRVVASEDTWNDMNDKTTAHGNDLRLASVSQQGECFVINTGNCTNLKNAAGWVKFNLSALPANATVTGATIQMWGGPTGIGAASVTAHRITGTWSEATMTTNTRPTVNSTNIVGSVTNQSGTMSVTFNVTTDVQNRATNTIANGWEFEPSANKDDSWWYSSEWTTASQRPVITVVYT